MKYFQFYFVETEHCTFKKIMSMGESSCDKRRNNPSVQGFEQAEA